MAHRDASLSGDLPQSVGLPLSVGGGSDAQGFGRTAAHPDADSKSVKLDYAPRLEVNRLTLDFTGSMRHLEPEFRHVYFTWSRAHVRLVIILSVVFYAIAALVDVLMARHLLAIASLRLLVAALVFGVGWLASFTTLFERIWQPMILLYIFVTAVGYSATIPLVPSEVGDLYFVVVIVCLIFGHTFANARFVTSTLGGSLAVIAHCLITLGPIGPAPSATQWASLAYLILVHALGMMVSRSLELANRRHFLLARRLEQEATKVAESNRNLETQVSQRTAELASANQDLRAEMERRLQSQQEKQRLSAQLQQAQKMQAIGQLAGGVAHDFNNILTAIVGNTQEVAMDVQADDPKAEALQEILLASERAAGLTRQLLTFARKQVAKPQLIHLTQVVDNTTRMLRRVIGADVELSTRSGAGLWPVFADPGQVQQILLNLAVNARDAMPDGGRLTIETDNLSFEPDPARGRAGPQTGDYVSIRVADTGCGIPAEARSRIFEPFYTTKELGKGTGLGLATVFGIAQQSGGHVEVESEPGSGTTFTVYLPRALKREETTAGPVEVTEPQPGRETVLVIEDDPAVRRVVVRMLEAGGYRPLVAESGTRAEQLATELETPPDLVLSDLVLPGKNGLECVDALMKRWPDLGVVFMSGHVDDAMLRRVEQRGYPIVGKPFRIKEILTAIRKGLHSP